MPTGRELMASAQSSMPTTSADEVFQGIESGQDLVILDVREPEEWYAGHIAQATFLARGRIEGRIEEMFPNKDASIVCH